MRPDQSLWGKQPRSEVAREHVEECQKQVSGIIVPPSEIIFIR